MKHVYKVLWLALLTLVAPNASAIFTYHFSQDVWDYGMYHYTNITLTLYYGTNGVLSTTITPSSPSAKIELSTRAYKADVQWTYNTGHGDITPEKTTLDWPLSQMYLYTGPSPLWPDLYYDTHPTFKAYQNGQLITENDTIDFGKKITFKIERNGYPGTMPIYFGSTSSLSTAVLFTVPGGVETMDTTLSDFWSKLSTLFGGENEVVNKQFYLGFYYYFIPQSSGRQPYIISSTTPIALRLTGNIITDPAVPKRLCADKSITFDVKYIDPPYKLNIRGSSNKTLEISDFPVSLTYADIAPSVGSTDGNFEIWACNAYDISQRTQRILVTYLPPPPNINDAIVNISKVSCDINSDGKISIQLPHEPVDSIIRYTCYNELRQSFKTDISSGGVATFANLSSGTYYFRVERNIVNGCYTEMGPYTVGIADKLTIYDIQNTRIQTCSYTKDAQLTISYSNGVGDVDFKFGNATVDTNIIDTLRSNTLYTFIAIDSKSCSSDPYSVTTNFREPLHISLNAHPIQCYGQTATEILNASGGSKDYRFSINGNNNVLPGTYTFLGSQHVPDYTIILTDSKECTDTLNTSFLEPSQLKFTDPPYSLSNYNGYGLKCPNDLSGSIKLHKTGGSGDIVFIIKSSEDIYGPANDSVFTSLNAGEYMAYMHDANNCSSDTVKNIILTEPEKVEFLNPVIVSETCRGTKDAGITLNVTGTPLSFQWFKDDFALDGKTSRNLASVDSGNFRLNITYNNNICDIFSPVYVVLPKAAVNYVYTTHESCADGEKGGEIRISGITGGTTPYTYVLNNGTENTLGLLPTVFNNINAATYTLEIRDAHYTQGGIFAEKCRVSKSITISPKQPVSISSVFTKPNCSGDSNGKIAVSINGPDNPVLTAWYAEAGDSIGTGTLLQNVPKGTYQAKITDNRNCTSIHNGFELQEPAPLQFTNIAIEKAACSTVTDGKISINLPVGGTPAYQYSKDAGQTWQNNPSFTALASGNYNLHIHDAHTCSRDTVISIEAYSPVITLTASDSVTCSGYTNGKLSTVASGSKTHGLGYTFILIPQNGGLSANNTGIFGNLTKGTFRMLAMDSQNCITDTLELEIGEPDLLTANLQLVDSASCNQFTGKIRYELAGGNGGNVLLWKNNALGEVINLNVSALKTGEYQLTVTDRKGCTAIDAIVVPDRPAPVISEIQMLKQPWCGKALGSAEVTVAGGSKPYAYLWDDDGETRTNIAGNLTKGTYHVQVTDRYQCTNEGIITLADGPVLTLASATQDPHCGHNDGSIQLSVGGGVYPFVYQWPDSVSEIPVTTPLMENLFSGKYNIIITDSVGCVKEFSVVLNDLSGPKITATGTTSSWCGLSHGTAKVLASGGTLPYSYSWTPEGSQQIIGNNASIDNLKAGNYTVRITDTEMCKAYKNITVFDSLELKPVLSALLADSASCGKPTGKLKVRMTGGLSPYLYQWNTGAKTDSIAYITAGTYKIRATDQRGCKDSLTMTLSDKKNPVIYFLSKESAYCGQASGSFAVGATLGKAPYQVFLSTHRNNKTPLTYNDVEKSYTAIIDSLLPLSIPYRAIISDAEGCESTEMGVLITDNNPLTTSLSNITPVSCFGLSDGKAVILAEHGYEPYTYEWSSNNINSSSNSSLPAGTFSVKITDARGCTKTYNATANPIPQPQPLSISDAYISSPSCYNICDASISITASGGNGSYIYIWNNLDTVQTATGLCPGENTLEVADAKNCRTHEYYMVINPDPLSETDLPDTVKVCSGQHYLANPGNNWNNVTWTSDNGLNYTGNILDISNQGSYIMNGYSSEGCTVKDTLTIIMTNDLLRADFLMMSEAFVGDTVVIVEVSWPVAEKYTWNYPKEANLIYDDAWYKELTFDEAGNYYVELTATLAGCISVVGKHIEILDIGEQEPEEIIEENVPLIKSFTAYPNPVDIDLNMDVRLSEEKDIRIEIYSLSGGALSRIVNDYGLNNYTLNINIEDLLPGTYVLKLVAGNEVKTKMLIVQ
jgi:hypothetical protein